MHPGIVIICPGETVSGGPEALHQLGAALRELGVAAAMCYFPFGQRFPRPAAYAGYDVPSCAFDQIGGADIVIPEARTGFARLFPDNPVWIWWLSVNHFQTATPTGQPARHLPIEALKPLRHLSQSAYARDFLARQGLQSQMLGDYLNVAHGTTCPDEAPRLRQVVYNPRKGAEVAKALAALLPDEAFIPIEGLSAGAVSALLRQSRLYIDFGSHPGKDRLPREAAMAGCCVLTGRKGAAGFAQDVAIPSEYRLDERAPDFAARASLAIRDLLDNFPIRRRDFDPYRARIAQERVQFLAQVEAAFVTGDAARWQRDPAHAAAL